MVFLVLSLENAPARKESSHRLQVHDCQVPDSLRRYVLPAKPWNHHCLASGTVLTNILETKRKFSNGAKIWKPICLTMNGKQSQMKQCEKDAVVLHHGIS